MESRPHCASLDRADEASRVHTLRRPRRRLGCAYLRRDGAPGAGGLGGHPPQLSGKRAAGNRQSHPQRRSSTRRIVCCRKRRIRGAQKLLDEGSRLSSHHGDAPANLGGYGLADSPVAFAAFMYDYNGGEPQGSLTKDEVLDNVTLYWLTNTAASSARIYWENDNRSNTSTSVQKTAEISLPVAVTVFPGEIYRAPKSWTQRAYRNLVYFNEVDKGGHFAAWEQPELFSAEVRAAFRSLR